MAHVDDFARHDAHIALVERLEIVLLALEHQKSSLRQHAIALVPNRDAEARLGRLFFEVALLLFQHALPIGHFDRARAHQVVVGDRCRGG